MSVLTSRTATCDVCEETQDFSYAHPNLPDGWVTVMLLRRISGGSRQVRHLDLCPRCQELALDALGAE